VKQTSKSAGSRPASVASVRKRESARRNASTSASALVPTAAAVRAGAGNGAHPVPCAIARRIAAGEFPPTQMGGNGCCAGRGSTSTDGNSPAHAAFIVSIAWSNRAARSANGTPSAANSGSR
jgi:hypothetical protein